MMSENHLGEADVKRFGQMLPKQLCIKTLRESALAAMAVVVSAYAIVVLLCI